MHKKIIKKDLPKRNEEIKLPVVLKHYKYNHKNHVNYTRTHFEFRARLKKVLEKYCSFKRNSKKCILN